jgi:hypothetical protein
MKSSQITARPDDDGDSSSDASRSPAEPTPENRSSCHSPATDSIDGGGDSDHASDADADDADDSDDSDDADDAYNADDVDDADDDSSRSRSRSSSSSSSSSSSPAERERTTRRRLRSDISGKPSPNYAGCDGSGSSDGDSSDQQQHQVTTASMPHASKKTEEWEPNVFASIKSSDMFHQFTAGAKTQHPFILPPTVLRCDTRLCVCLLQEYSCWLDGAARFHTCWFDGACSRRQC